MKDYDVNVMRMQREISKNVRKRAKDGQNVDRLLYGKHLFLRVLIVALLFLFITMLRQKAYTGASLALLAVEILTVVLLLGCRFVCWVLRVDDETTNIEVGDDGFVYRAMAGSPVQPWKTRVYRVRYQDVSGFKPLRKKTVVRLYGDFQIEEEWNGAMQSSHLEKGTVLELRNVHDRDIIKLLKKHGIKKQKNL